MNFTSARRRPARPNIQFTAVAEPVQLTYEITGPDGYSQFACSVDEVRAVIQAHLNFSRLIGLSAQQRLGPLVHDERNGVMWARTDDDAALFEIRLHLRPPAHSGQQPVKRVP